MIIGKSRAFFLHDFVSSLQCSVNSISIYTLYFSTLPVYVSVVYTIVHQYVVIIGLIQTASFCNSGNYVHACDLFGRLKTCLQFCLSQSEIFCLVVATSPLPYSFHKRSGRKSEALKVWQYIHSNVCVCVCVCAKEQVYRKTIGTRNNPFLTVCGVIVTQNDSCSHENFLYCT